jgi:hypothetical protein
MHLSALQFSEFLFFFFEYNSQPAHSWSGARLVACLAQYLLNT